MPPSERLMQSRRGSPASHGRRSPPGPPLSLAHGHISQALLTSQDEGETLDFSHLNLGEVRDAALEELASIGKEFSDDASTVSRLALASNHLTTLPRNFTLLTRLRYLNLRSNMFTSIPDVLTALPSLEILDLSRNKIRRFPPNPGSLVNLTVLHMAKNRLDRLPTYFPEFKKLKVMKFDHNPFIWPPNSVMQAPRGDDSESMLLWVVKVKRWIQSNTPDIAGSHHRVNRSDELGKMLRRNPDFDLASDDDYPLPYAFGARDVPVRDVHNRSLSIDSVESEYSFVSQNPGVSSSPQREQMAAPDISSSTNISSSPFASPSLSPDASIATPDDQHHPDQDDTMTLNSFQHVRNASYSVGGRIAPLNTGLTLKKSLPDLRSGYTASSDRKGLNRQRPSIPADDQILPLNGKHDHVTPAQIYGRSPAVPPVPTPARPALAMDVERNRYFRRLSTLGQSTIAKAVPAPLLNTIDAVRGIFFALSQIHTSLTKYTENAIDERLANVLDKVLNPARTYLEQLINALDRFDSSSRRGIPPPAVSRGVFEACRDSVAVFGKVAGVLQLQLKVLAGSDDVRYTRTLLLMLYGAMAEISHSWQTMAPQMEAIQHLLRDGPPVAKSTLKPSVRAPISPIAEGEEASSPPVPRNAAASTSHAVGRSRTTRRHAGSFSSKDVQIGKEMSAASGEPVPAVPAIPVAIPPMPPLRSALRNPITSHGSPTARHTPPLSVSESPPTTTTHSREGSLSSIKSPPSAQSHEKLVDQNLLDTMSTATTNAQSVWQMMDEILDDVQEVSGEVRESLAHAKDATSRLRGSIRAVDDGAGELERRALWEDANAFAQSIVQIFTVLKTFSVSHPLSSTLRNNVINLTQNTQDFAILLSVSSFAPPSGSARTFAPPGTGPSASLDEGRTTPLLSRARSANAAQGGSSSARPLKDTPWSALPHQGFKVPTPPRIKPSAYRYDDYFDGGAV